MCLDHSSGLPGTQWKHFSVSTTSKFDYYSEVLNYLSNSTLKADPGTYSTYCNDGFTLAEMVVSKVPVADVIDAARKALYTGHIGDGKIFVYDVENVIKVRTGEEAYEALQDND